MICRMVVKIANKSILLQTSSVYVSLASNLLSMPNLYPKSAIGFV